MKRHALLVACAVLGYTGAAQAEEFTHEVGGASQDTYLRDLLVNSDQPMLYASADYDLGSGFEATAGIAVGEEEQVNNLSLEVSRTFEYGPFSLELSVGGYHYWELEDTVGYLAGELMLAVFDPVAIGVARTDYFGDFEDKTSSAFVSVDSFGAFDLEAGYSWLDSGNEGSFVEIGWTFAGENIEPRLWANLLEGDRLTLGASVRF